MTDNTTCIYNVQSAITPKVCEPRDIPWMGLIHFVWKLLMLDLIEFIFD